MVIISGISHGLGHEIANLFAENDWRVYGTGRSERPSDLNTTINYCRLDGSDREAVGNFINDVKTEETDEITLINNAGGFAGTDLTKTEQDDFAQMIQTNYLTSVYLTETAVKAFNKLRILNVISTSALAPSPHASAYGASKAATRHFFQSLQKELGADNYRITNIYPDKIATYGNPPEGIKPADLANFIYWQASQPSSFFIKDVTLNTIQ
jgi:NADP-dependent 3-hydroxy acid dehydrogenase YdfG